MRGLDRGSGAHGTAAARRRADGGRAIVLAGAAALLSLFLALSPAPARAGEIHGFVESLAGARTAEGGGFETGSYTARESRLQLKASDWNDVGEAFARLDVASDPVAGGGASLELREAHATYTGWSAVTVQVGRQITTWGTGDLLFVNDVFPKDWESFFVGREDQYLKAPLDALRLTVYSGLANVDVVLVPGFEPDRLPTPGRLAFYQPPGVAAAPLPPGSAVQDGEAAFRVARAFGGLEAAAYGYVGWWRQPVGLYPDGTPFHPALNVWGASVRRGLLGGVANLEAGWYDSVEDPAGDDPLVENSSLRAMAGYDRSLGGDLTLGAQGYVERMADHDLYVAGLPAGARARDELRQVYAARVTRWLQYQTLTLSLFGFASPTDEDYYLRARAGKKISDPLLVEIGANVFGGKRADTLFGQLDANDNVTLRVRYDF